MSKFKVGDAVFKLKGTKFPGIVVAVFKTIHGDERVVIECMVPQVRGLLHIYDPEQLEYDEWAQQYIAEYHEAAKKLA